MLTRTWVLLSRHHHIAGLPAVLERIFVKASEGGLVPAVEHLDVFGTSLSGTPVNERIRAH